MVDSQVPRLEVLVDKAWTDATMRLNVLLIWPGEADKATWQDLRPSAVSGLCNDRIIIIIIMIMIINMMISPSHGINHNQDKR